MEKSVAMGRGRLDLEGMMALAKPVITVRVRDLVEFVHRSGNLAGDGLFVGPDRALAGTLGHQWLQRSRPPEYQKEVRLSHDVEGEEFILRIQGRLDGVIVEKGGVKLEEIKTVGHGWKGIPDPLHWGQAKCYAYIFSLAEKFDAIVIQLTYLDLDSRKTIEFREPHAFEELRVFFLSTVAIYQQWMQEQLTWRKERNVSISGLAFPFSHYRPGQRELAVAVYRALVNEKRLFLEAPTGIGKTISVLFPAVKAMGEGRLERIFYLTATTVGRVVAEKAVADLRRANLLLRTLTLTAKSKVCVQNGQPCDVRTCPLAIGYFDRRRAAMRAALAVEELTRPAVEMIAQKYQVCPFELSLDLSEWVEVVICDYNYVFDPQVYLRRHFAEDRGRYGFLVDEAHNLVDRARAMFSADLNAGEMREVARAIKKSLPRCAKKLNHLSVALARLAKNAETAFGLYGEFAQSEEADLFVTAKTSGRTVPRASRRLPDQADEIAVLSEIPHELLPLLEETLSDAAEWLARNEPAEFRDLFLDFYFRLHSFVRTAGYYDERYLTLVKSGPSAEIKLFCLDPSFLLRQVLDRCRGVVFFSATLTPTDYYRRLLGGEESDPAVRLPSPFPPENLCLLVHDRIRTHYSQRENSLAEVVDAIRTLIAGKMGNYLVYLPSYRYLTTVLAAFEIEHADVTVMAQRPGMSEGDREAFLRAFAVEDGRTLVGFAVLGGIFGEGIDLVGERLIGAVIVGVGLPQLDVKRDLIATYFEENTGHGFEYAYTFPGMNRVLQAAGRVIRSETDRGVVLLIDARYCEGRYRRLFPKGWRPVGVRSDTLREKVQDFWSATSADNNGKSA